LFVALIVVAPSKKFFIKGSILCKSPIRNNDNFSIFTNKDDLNPPNKKKKINAVNERTITPIIIDPPTDVSGYTVIIRRITIDNPIKSSILSITIVPNAVEAVKDVLSATTNARKNSPIRNGRTEFPKYPIIIDEKAGSNETSFIGLTKICHRQALIILLNNRITIARMTKIKFTFFMIIHNSQKLICLNA
jgi:hypothetical protein